MVDNTNTSLLIYIWPLVLCIFPFNTPCQVTLLHCLCPVIFCFMPFGRLHTRTPLSMYETHRTKLGGCVLNVNGVSHCALAVWFRPHGLYVFTAQVFLSYLQILQRPNQLRKKTDIRTNNCNNNNGGNMYYLWLK